MFQLGVPFDLYKSYGSNAYMLIPDVFSKFPGSAPTRGICHVGSHTGEERGLYHSLGMLDANILWIDANADYASSFDPARECFLRALVADSDGEPAVFRITNNGQSSSMLPLKEHLREHPWVHEVEQRAMTTITMDTLFRVNGIPYDKYDVMNLDIQGAELRALRGATKILPHIKAIYTEVNERELYEGCALLPELDGFLAGHGFKKACISMTDHGWGDALYLREN